MPIVRTHPPRQITATPAADAPRLDGDADRRVLALGPAAILARRKRCVVTVDGVELLVIFHRRQFRVVENRCPHAGADLEDARISRGTLTCSLHGYRYSLADGAFASVPWCVGGTDRRLAVYSSRVVDGWLYAISQPGGPVAGDMS
jgi:nitrite reductase/ring-hydroxylating ferredoxin subunit